MPFIVVSCVGSWRAKKAHAKPKAPTLRIGTGAVCARLGKSRMQLDRWIKLGRFPAPHYIGIRRAWFVAEVEAWEAAEMNRLPGERRTTARNLPRSPPGAPKR